ncbi:uncharacterized protein ColSpa_02198 [Colletotrichum spaethianum]|uniref:Uncharacterized protein n=1 Tax=Colletotrichum spaethianum TaxID=700344 RepID=A0AA37L549_9PEZI|nr:uncharacterized protein ColSpa_02198 [Colletotrichum spaethianum]GKT42017.1 hypothetical protein ColSpa_02198 [Colletotrichum spaethianum]
MFRMLGAAGRKAKGAQADIKVQESNDGHEVENDVETKMKKEDADPAYKKNDGRHEIDDFLDYVKVKLEDLELEDETKQSTPLAKTENISPKMEEVAAPKENFTPKKKNYTSQTKSEKKAENAAMFFSQWDEYFGKSELADWQRLCRDLGLPDDLPSKTQCRKVSTLRPYIGTLYRKTELTPVPSCDVKALSKVHVNIKQFLDAMNGGGAIKLFQNVRQLAQYTRKTGLWMPKKNFPKGHPLGQLRREITKYLG